MELSNSESLPPMLPASVRRAADALPSISMEMLNRCARPKTPRPALSSCVHLANPATGSSTLAHRFFNHPSLQNYSAAMKNGTNYPRGNLFSGPWSHSHSVSAEMIQQKLRRGGNLGRTRYRTLRLPFPPTRCFVLTVRDPAARLASGYRSSDATNGRLARWSADVVATPGGERNLSTLIARLRSYTQLTARTQAEVARLDNATREIGVAYESSAGKPSWCCLPGDYPPPERGDLFLISQLHYLRGINCSDAQVVFICTERFESGWARFLGSFGHGASADHTEPQATPSNADEHEVLNARSNATRSRGRTALRRSALSEEDQAFVRDVLYPWDTALHRWACGR